MPDFRDVFEMFRKRNKVFLVVIHAETPEQTARNADLAFSGGADGIFLVNHSIGFMKLIEAYGKVRQKYPEKWIGFNFLDLKIREALTLLPATANGIWFDDAGYKETASLSHRTDPLAELRYLHREKASHALLFGGVAHKGNALVRDVREAAQVCAPYLDVMVTTGPGTGKQADPKKIHQMRNNCSPTPLALASGVTSENVYLFIHEVDCLMVNSGISISFSELDPEKVFSLNQMIRRLSEPSSPKFSPN